MLTIPEDRLLARHRRAVQLSVDVVAAVVDAPLAVETPCTG
ncbi:hypothetical protein [Nocardia sp. MW-W600-9]